MNDERIEKELENIKNITMTQQIAIESLRAITAEHSKQIEKIGMAVNENSKQISKLDSALNTVIAKMEQLASHVKETNKTLKVMIMSQQSMLNNFIKSVNKEEERKTKLLDKFLDTLARISIIAIAGYFGLKLLGM